MPPDQRLIPLFAAEEQQRLRALDVAFARFLAELDAQADGAWLLLAALLSRRVADGHLCLDLSLWQPLAEEQAWPAPWTWRDRSHSNRVTPCWPIFPRPLMA